MAIALTTMFRFDESLDRYVSDIINVEKGTGFSWVGKGMSDLSFNVDVISSTTVPEPGTLSMLFLGLTLAGAFSLLKLRSA